MTESSAAEAERHANELRRDLGATLDQIVENLSPSGLAAEAVRATSARTPGWIKRTIVFLETPTGLSILGGITVLGIAVAMSSRYRRRR